MRPHNPLWSVFVSLVVCLAPVAAKDAPWPVCEEEIVREMEALIDRTGPVDPGDWKKAKKLVDKGIKAHDQRRYETAIEEYRSALEIHPLYASAYYELAYSLSMAGDQAGALDAAIRALTINPKEEMFYIQKGNILDNLGLIESAEATYRELIAVQPASYMGHLNLGICLNRQGKYDEAEQEYLAAREADPDHPSSWLHMSSLARARGHDYMEEEMLEAFLERGKDDPRAPRARERLEELNSQEIELDPDAEYSQIAMMVELSRSLWRGSKHRETFPDARGYALTYEEERQIYAELVLPTWREEKEKDPSASHGFYDLLLALDDAGFLDEYIWYTNQNTIGEQARDWVQRHPDRIEAFLDRAREAGYLREEASDETGAGEAEAEPSLMQKVTSIMDASEVMYRIDDCTLDDAARYQESEAARFRNDVTLTGEDRLSCSKVWKAYSEKLDTSGASAVVPVLRCFDVSDERTVDAIRQLSRVAVRRQVPPVELGVAVLRAGEGVTVGAATHGRFGYAMAKAAWREEPALRQAYGGPEDDRATLLEEVFAWAGAAESYEVLKANAEEEGEGFEEDPLMEYLLKVVESENLPGFVLYEVLHGLYGVSLRSLEESHATYVSDYLLENVLVLVARSGQGQ